MQKMQWVLLCFLGATLARAQSPKELAKALQSSLTNQQLVLENFSGQETVRGSWSGTGLVLEPPQWREFGILKVDAVELKGKELTLRCTRRSVVRDKNGRTALYGQPSKVTIDVDLQGADPKQALALIPEALFFPSVEDAIAAIPKELQKTIPFPIDAPRSAPHPATKPEVAMHCDCARSDKTPCDTDGGKNAEVRPPKFLHGTDPQFSDEARGSKVNGNVIVHFVVDKAGNPQDLWVLRPLGRGLDEAAAQSVLSYRFQPATCRGNPVSVYLNVEVNFQIY